MNITANWSYPTAIRFGAGRISEIPEACATAGIKKGDNILSINGTVVNSPEDLIKIIQKNKGKTIGVAFERGGESNKVSVSL